MLDNHYKLDIESRTERITKSNASMCEYYVKMGLLTHSNIYHSLANDYHRKIISRWRLSCHNLKIETLRRSRVDREERTCELCGVLEDENHVIYICPRYSEIRTKYQDLLQKNYNVEMLLNPTYTKIIETSEFLHEVEALRLE